MDYLRKAQAKLKDVVRETVGGGSTDDVFDAQRSRIAALEGLVGTLKVSFESYSCAMAGMSQTSVDLANKVQRFYRKSANRQASVNLYCDSQFNLDAHTTDVFKDQFGWDILKKFDDWEDDLGKAREDISQAELVHASVQKLSHQTEALKTINDKKNSASSNKNYEDAVFKLTNSTAAMGNLRAKLDTDVSKLVEGRFARFDELFVRIMECQMEFYAKAAELTSSFQGNVDNYRNRFPRRTSIVPETSKSKKEKRKSKKSSSKQRADLPVHEEEPSVREVVSNPMHAAIPQQEPEFKPIKQPKQPEQPTAPKANGANQHHATQDLFGFDSVGAGGGSESATTNLSTPPKQSPPKQKQASSPDLLDMFSTAPSSSPPEVDIFASGNNNGNSGLDFFSAIDNTQTTKTRKASVDPFGFDPLASPSPSPRQSKEQAQSNTTAQPAAHSEEYTDLYAAPTMPSANSTQPKAKPKANPQASGDIFGSMFDATPEQDLERRGNEKVEQLRDRNAADANAAEEKHVARDTMEDRLNAWELKNGSRNNIRTLLSTLDTVLWPEANKKWKKLSIADLLDNKNIKRGYRKSLFVVHPDRLPKTATAEQKVIAERAFEVLNESFKEFEGQTQ